MSLYMSFDRSTITLYDEHTFVRLQEYRLAIATKQKGKIPTWDEVLAKLLDTNELWYEQFHLEDNE